jgi:muramoyltetrapeptide carboxypeptidase
MLKGRVLRPGGTIGVPAPASPYHNRSEVLRGVEWWESKGYKVKLGRNIFARDAYVAGLRMPGPGT